VLTFALRRLVWAVVLLAITTLVTFGIFFGVPRLAGQTTAELATGYVGRDPSPQAIAAVTAKLHLDDSIYLQYGRFVKGIVAGEDYRFGPEAEHCPAPCLGYSFKTHQPVWPQIKDRLPITVSLAAGAAVFWLVGGVGVGVLSALRRGSALDRAAMATALAGVSLPIFFTGLLSLALFSYKLGWFPDVHYVGLRDDPLLWARNLTLPWITLAFLYAALYARLTRSSMLEAMGEDFIRTARAKGLRERQVVTRHALRASLTPILTIFGLDLGLLLGGAFLTESTYSLPGIGKFAVDAVTGKDLPAILGVTLVGAFFVVIANFLVDVMYAAVDPRVRT